MSITPQQVADLQPGDVVELRLASGATIRGPLAEDRLGSLGIDGAGWNVRLVNGEPAFHLDDKALTLTVVSRAPRPLYVNHSRTEPVPKDVVLDGEGVVRYVAHTATGLAYWSHDYEPGWGWTHHSNPPKPLRLLVDGENGMAVTPDAAEVWDEGFEAGHHWWNVGMSGIPHDPPRNPYETGQVVP